ncbi:expressed protein [Echinococcus multilocularis]|uniref:Expressed protein n=1 Tax=Echinococcus multilocularis TaxID=6211 RepID=A0A068Y7J7_ECHMU|nr:expressed protein [Echinococcus multilocularis]
MKVCALMLAWECDAAKAVTDVLLLNHQDSATFSLLVLYGHHDRQSEIDDDYRDIATSFCSRSIALSVGAGAASYENSDHPCGGNSNSIFPSPTLHCGYVE